MATLGVFQKLLFHWPKILFAHGLNKKKNKQPRNSCVYENIDRDVDSVWTVIFNKYIINKKNSLFELHCVWFTESVLFGWGEGFLSVQLMNSEEVEGAAGSWNLSTATASAPPPSSSQNCTLFLASAKRNGALWHSFHKVQGTLRLQWGGEVGYWGARLHVG